MPKSPRWRAVCAIGATGAVLVAGCGDDAREAPTAERPAYLTLLIGRTVPHHLDECVVVEGAVDVFDLAEALSERGIAATGSVVVDRVHDERPPCDPEAGEMLHPTWDELARLRDEFGWTFVSNGATHTELTELDADGQERETCGSLQELEAHGHDRAWGLFASANGVTDDDVQADLVSTCFAFGRRYGEGVTRRGDVGSPWYQSTRSVNGGRCADGSLPCADVEVPNDREYDDPASVARSMSAGADEWRVVQFYRFVVGSRSEGLVQWDCTGEDWRSHWTNRAERYCLGDLLSALDDLPAGVDVVDPATVAEAWGRLP